VENAMIAVIDLPNLLALQVDDDGDNAEPKSVVSTSKR
jgi:hypothetical protein